MVTTRNSSKITTTPARPAIQTAEVGGWYDCGKLDTFLETNQVLLEKGAARRGAYPGVTFIDPVLIEDGATITNSTVGPNVTLEKGCVVADSTLAHSLVGQNCRISGSKLSHSMLGNRVTVRGFAGSLSVGDDSEISGG